MNVDEISQYYADALYYSHRFEEFTSGLPAVWNDSAAHTLQTRVLEPHGEDCESMLRTFEDQYRILQEIQVAILQTEEYEIELRQFQSIMDSEEEYAQNQIQKALIWSDQFSNHEDIITSQLSEIYRYIKSARQQLHQF